jgi:hypothetical protein
MIDRIDGMFVGNFDIEGWAINLPWEHAMHGMLVRINISKVCGQALWTFNNPCKHWWARVANAFMP